MVFSRSVIASALVGFGAVQAQTAPLSTLIPLPSGAAPAAPGAPATPGMVNTHVVQVGGSAANATLKFYPENLQAAVGDLVQFQFMSKNHSVAQSTFDAPCIPIQNMLPNKTDAFYSGFMPAAAAAGSGNGTAGGLLTYTIRVMDDKPIWYYCSQGQHCQNGMVGAINAAATGNKTMESFKALAAQASENLSPGQAPGSGVPSDNTNPAAPGAPQPSGGAGGATPPSPTNGAGASGTNGASPAEQTQSAGHSLSPQSFFSLAMCGLVALMAL